VSTLAVICKAPLAGLVKTRLSPPLTMEEAARLAEACLYDTFEAVRATPCDRRVAILDGRPGPWLGAGIEVIPQRGGGLDARLAGAFEDLGAPTVIIGMDTPQVSPELLTEALAATAMRGAALGVTVDGGYWAIGLGRVDRLAIEGVPMSTDCTGALQRARLLERGFDPAALPVLVDVDDIGAARRVARLTRQGRFGAVLATIDGLVAA
jgi:uncharacterized protein